jgi:hypothetical protein
LAVEWNIKDLVDWFIKDQIFQFAITKESNEKAPILSSHDGFA